jgi:hypothetical protein
MPQRFALDSIAGYHNMVRQNKLTIAANLTLKAILQKCASASYITKFPLHDVRYEHCVRMLMHGLVVWLRSWRGTLHFSPS